MAQGDFAGSVIKKICSADRGYEQNITKNVPDFTVHNYSCSQNI